MWTEYKRTAVVIQLFIIALIGTVRWRAHTPWDALLFVFIFLQLGALAGAWFGARLKKQAQKSDDQLPLQR
jgi:uncharacterized membrane protein YfcA